MHYIKQLKPSRKSRFKQGYINPLSCKKLFESKKNEPIIYRSSWEKEFIYWCEGCSNVKGWSSEPGGLPYNLPDGTTHMYYPDFSVLMTNGEHWLVEVKPYAQTQKPKMWDNDIAKETYIKNVAKWKAAHALCKQKGWKFIIITEHFIKNLKYV